jgi:hypothetical protein
MTGAAYARFFIPLPSQAPEMCTGCPEGHSVPYFNHKQLSFSFIEAQSMAKTAEKLKFPLLAGSSMPVTWRLPDPDIPLGAKAPVMVGVGSFDGMDFDALNAMESRPERRKGGRLGVKGGAVAGGGRCMGGQAAGLWSDDLLSSALSRSDTPLELTMLDGRTQDLASMHRSPQIATLV